MGLDPGFRQYLRTGQTTTGKQTGRFIQLTILGLFLVGAIPAGLFAEIAGPLKIAGNGPELPTIESLARAFEKANPRAYVDVAWDDHSKPIEMLRSGEAHIAVTGVKENGLASTQIAWDGIGILVHLSNFTKELTKQQVADIFSGKVTHWSELGGPDTAVVLIDRPKQQNIRDAFEQLLGITGKIPENTKVIAKDEKVVKTVVGTLPPLSAVTYISLSQGLSAVASGVAVRLVPVEKAEPEVPTVRDGRYPLRRPILLISGREPSPLIEAFNQFALSPPGQKIISEVYVPIEPN